MSDVVVLVIESLTSVVVSEQDVAVAITETPVQVSASTVGLQGASYAPGDPIYVTVRNSTGSTLPKGSIVYVSGGNGTHTQVSKALATTDATSIRVLGWLSNDIANNATGLCMVEGYLDGVNTMGVAEGTQLYLSGVTAGAFTATVPSAPIHTVYVGVCVKASAGNGRVYVKVQNGYGLNELHDVLLTSPTNSQVLAYDSATGLWKNATNAPDGVTSLIVSSPLTGGTVTSTGTIGLNQALLSLTRSQISDFTSGTVANISGTVSSTQVFGLLADLVKNPDLLIVGSITRNSNDVVTSADVSWPDSTAGTFTASTINTIYNTIDAYNITYGAPATRTYYQDAVTRNSNGAVTNIPAIRVV